MAQSQEEVEVFCRDVLTREVCTINELKRCVSNHFGTSLSGSDNAFIKEIFIDTVLKLWQDESMKALENNVTVLKNDIQGLMKFSGELFDRKGFNDPLNFMISPSYQIILINRKLFQEEELLSAFKRLILHAKIKIKNLTNSGNVHEFLEELIGVIKDADLNYEEVIKSLCLREFYKAEGTKIEDVFNLILKSNFNDKLKKLALDLLNDESLSLSTTIRSELYHYLYLDKDIVRENDRKTLILMRKIITMKDIRDVTDDVKDIRVICDIFHGCKDPISQQNVFKFFVDNFDIIANEIIIHDQITIDLSGKDAERQETSEAGRDDDDRGLNGRDGEAGESGGNIGIFCDKIHNGNFLTLKSNGGCGSNGQNGGDGVNGKDGKDVQKENLSFNGVQFKATPYTTHPEFCSVSGYFSFISKDGVDFRKVKPPQGKQGILDKKDNLYKIGYEHVGVYINGVLLVQGGNGTRGTNGGLGGLGGEGGRAGQIQLDINDDDGLTINTVTINGSNGKDGEGGFNGLNGVDGRDAWVYDQDLWSDGEFWGLKKDEKNKFEMCNGNKNDINAVWSNIENNYKVVKLKCSIKSNTTQRERHLSTAIRSRSSYAKAKTKECTFNKNVKSQYSEFLNTSLKVQTGSHSIDIKLATTKATTKTNIKVMTQQTFNHGIGNKKILENSREVLLTLPDIRKKILTEDFKFTEFLDIIKRSDKNRLVEIRKIMVELFSLNHAKIGFFSNCFKNSQNFKSYQDMLCLIDEKLALEKLKFESSKLPISGDLYVPTKIEQLIPYLKDTRLFGTHLLNHNSQIVDESLKFTTVNHYFNSDSELNRSQIKEMFDKMKNNFFGTFINKVTRQDDKKYLDFFINLAELLISNKNEISNRLEVLESFEQKYKKVRNDNSGIVDEVKKLFKNQSVSNFVEENIIDRGIRSPIYKSLIAYLFQLTLRIFVRKVNGSICLGEEYEHKSSRNDLKLNLLMHRETYTVLEFNKNRYKRDKERRLEAQNCKDIVDKVLKIPQNLNVENLIENILSYFPQVTQDEHDQLEIALHKLRDIDLSILLSIHIRLFYENIQVTIHELTTIIFIIVQIILKQPKFAKYFTAKFLASDNSKWINEIILLAIEDYTNEEIPARKLWIDCLNEVAYHPILVLFLIKIEKLDESAMTISDFEMVLRNMRYFSQVTFNHLLSIQELSSWQNVITSEYWLNKYNFLTDHHIQIVNELQNKFGTENLEELLTIFDKKSESLDKIDLLDFLKNFNNGEWIFSKEQLRILEKNDPRDWKEKINKIYFGQGQRTVNQIVLLIKDNNDTSESIKKMIDDIGRHVDYILTKERENFSEIKLRNTQFISILTLASSERGALIQVGTGEGKTFIGVGLILAKTQRKEKIHIVTSSNVLAIRDATNPGIVKFLESQKIKIGHNCHETIEERRQVYMECDVVYGTLGNFQRDYLLTCFYDQNILPEEYFQNVLVDEVDSILLDKGNNILYLSKELPDVDELESAFMFIWHWVNDPTATKEELEIILKPEIIRQVFLDNFYGLIYEEDIAKIASIGFTSSVMKILKDKEIINDEKCLLIQDLKQYQKKLITELTSIDLSEESRSKIIYYIKRKIESPKVIKIPKFYHKFVMRYLDKWIKSALNAILLQEGVQYVIDRIENDSNIIILDIDTGNDQKNSEFDEGLCQFLQLKHGCRLSLLSLKSVFISNVSYFKLYGKNIYGMTGTLGSKDERNNFNKFYGLDYATIPSYLPKKFTELEPIIAKTNDEWLTQIVTETKTMFIENRSVLVICNTIKDIQAIEATFTNEIDDEDIRTYKRDYEEFNICSLQPKKLIIATNLAGRGTDIKLSEELSKSGGLHVILTYLAPNVRVENQAYGRAARSGAKGSARMIVLNSSNNKIKDLKHERDQQELIRLEEVSNFYQKFITVEESYFMRFLEAYKKYSEKLSKDNSKIILLENFKVIWSLWLDENTEHFKSGEKNVTETLNKSFDEFIERSTKENIFTVELHSVSRVQLFKNFIKSNNIHNAEKILNAKELDIFSCDYYKIYLMLYKLSIKHSFNQFSLNQVEIKTIRNMIEKLKDAKNNKTFQSTAIKIFKQKYQTTLVPMEGFENQSEEINEAYEILADSLKSIIGTGVTPESFNSCIPFGNPIFNEGFYNYLLEKGYIENMTVDTDIEFSVVEKIAKKYFINSSKFLKFLNDSLVITSLDDLFGKLDTSFEFASRERFWKALVDDKVLANEIQYAIVDLKTIKDYLPCLELECYQKLRNDKITKFEKTEYERFFINFEEDNERIERNEAMALKCSESLKSNVFFKQLVALNAVTFNMKATLRKTSEIEFENFDSIKEEDFDFVNLASIRRNIIESLLNQEILQKVDNNMKLHFEKLTYLKLDENFMYEVQVKDLLESKFQFRIAYENLIKNEEISLLTNPHKMMVEDLIQNFMILPSKVNLKRLDSLKDDVIFNEHFSKESMIDFLKNGFFNIKLKLPQDTNYNELVDDLVENKVLYKFRKNVLENISNHASVIISGPLGFTNILSGSIGIHDTTKKLSRDFKNVEESVKKMLNQKKMLIENKEEIVKTFKKCVPKFQNRDLDNLKPVLKPLESFIKNSNAAHNMQLKGFDSVIEVERHYKWTYYVGIAIFLSALVFGLIKISLAIALTGEGLLLLGIFLDILNEIRLIINHHRNGTFFWKNQLKRYLTDYLLRRFKLIFYIYTTCKAFVVEKKNQLVGKIVKKKETKVTSNTSMTELRKKQENILKTTVKANANIDYSKDIERNVSMTMDSLWISVKNSTMTKFYHIKSNDFFKTIESFLSIKSAPELESLIMSELSILTKTNDYFKNFLIIIGDKVHQMIKLNPDNIASTDILKGPANVLINLSTQKIFDDMNHAIKSKMEVPETKTHANGEFSEKVLRLISTELINKLEDDFHHHVRVPALNRATKRAVTFVAEGYAQQIKENMIKQREKDFTKGAIMKNFKNEDLKNQEQLTIDQELAEIMRKKITKIKDQCPDPKIIAQLIKIDSPLSLIELEAAAKVCNRSFEINFENRVHNFGNEDLEVLRINLKEFSKSNSQTPVISYEKLLKYLNDKNIIKDMSEIEFRNKITDILVNETKVVDEKQIYHTHIGFYGISERLRLYTKSDSEKFVNIEEDVFKNVYMGYRTSLAFSFKPNQDLRTFDSNGYPKSIITHEKFNEYRNEALQKTLQHINQLIRQISKELNPLTLHNFYVSNFVGIGTSESFKIFLPIEMTHKLDKLNVIIDFDIITNDADEPEIPFIGAEISYDGLQKSLILKTLMPSMNSKADNLSIPSKLCKKQIRNLAYRNMFLDHTKIFDKKYSHLKLVNFNSYEKTDELPSKKDFDCLKTFWPSQSYY